jgi:predicted transcriptional regulator
VASIVSAHVSHNPIPADDLPALISSVYSALVGLGSLPVVAEELRPAVAIKKSVFPDYIVCLEDGKKLKMLKRHLASSYSMTPEQYRERWGLPHDYPMVAPSYASRRSELAKSFGLGLGRKRAEPVEVIEEPKAPKKAGRSKKAS